jgi:tRNA-2-methylthio-N6-dimethylallyladenosine synthase
MVEQVQLSESRPVEIAFYRDSSYMEDSDGRTQVQGARAFVTIMQGCNKVCSFCIVPHVRGREASRPSARIIAEIESLVCQGVIEVMLLGQNVNSYGKMSPGEPSFGELLRRVNAIDGLQRIRFTTSHPQDLSPELIEAFATLDKLCEHLHLPVQSGSDSVLTRMRRGYTREGYLNRLDRLRKRCPKVGFSTDIIVGFPGETDAEFADTLEMLKQVEYDEIFSFVYSPRPQTVSAKIYQDDVSQQTKKDRLKEVQSLQKAISIKKNRERIGNVEEILVDGRSKLKHEQIMGRTRDNRIVNVTASEPHLGSLLRVRIVGATPTSLIGDLLTAGHVSEFQSEGEMA